MRLFASRSVPRKRSPKEGVADETATGTGQPANPPKKTLIVDDTPIILKTTSLKMKSRGNAVVTTMDGRVAITKVRKQNPDLILLDIRFPPNKGAVAWEDGILVMYWLRRLEEARHIPIIVITGGNPMVYKNRSLAAGATALFRKPIDPADLPLTINRTVSRIAEAEQAGYAPSFQI